jgi:putative two-component system response regulator
VKTIFVVDDNDVNLFVAEEALSDDYRVFTLPSARQLFELLKEINPDLILLDIIMPETDGFETLKRLKSNSLYAKIPIIFLTSRNDAETESLGLEKGAMDFIAKPFSKPVLLNRIRTHLGIEEIIRERTYSLMRLRNGIVSVLANMVENRDKMTGSHIERTTAYIRVLLDAMLEGGLYADELSQWDMEMAVSSARLHDIGKIVITDLILNKPGKLTDEEFAVIKTHPAEGERIIEDIVAQSGDEAFLQYARLFAVHHHERWDGRGYPYGMKGEEIPLQGRVMALADVYDALVSDRPYKHAFTREKAKEIIMENRGTHFDPKIVDVFFNVEPVFAEVRECR